MYAVQWENATKSALRRHQYDRIRASHGGDGNAMIESGVMKHNKRRGILEPYRDGGLFGRAPGFL